MNNNKDIHITFMRSILTLIMVMMVNVGAWAENEVAQIDESRKYATLQAAIDAAGTVVDDVTLGTNITLLANVTEAVTVAGDKNITIQLEDYNITSPTDATAITNAGTLTITGTSGAVDKISNSGTLNINGTTGTFASIVNTGFVTMNSATITELQTSGEGDVTQTSGTITTLTAAEAVTGNITVTNALNINIGENNVSNLVISSGTSTITGTGTIATLDNSGAVTFSEATQVTSLNAKEGSSVTIGADARTVVTTLNNTGTSTITGEGITSITGAGTVKLGGDITNEITAEGVTIDLNGHTAAAITVADSKALTITGVAENSKVTTLTVGEGSTLNLESGAVTTLDAKANAKVNINSASLPTNITTAETAAFSFNNITSSNVTTALAYTNVYTASFVLAENISDVNIPVNKNITLDVKGQSITGTLTNAGSLTLKDSNADKNSIAALTNTGTLTVQSGNVTTLDATNGSTTVTDGTIDAMNVSGEATATINGGTITTLTATNDKVTVNGGSITNFTDSTGTISFNVDSAEEMTQALSASKAAITLEQNISGDFIIAVGKEVTLTMNSHTLTGSTGATITNKGTLTIANSNGSINAANEKIAIVNNGTLNMGGAAVASATLNGTQTITGGTLTAATLGASRTLTVNGGNVTSLTAENGSTVDGQSGTITTITTSGNVNIKGTGFHNLAGTGTYTLEENISSNIIIPAAANVTLALADGKTLSATSGNTVTVASGATLTVSGAGTINAASDNVYAIQSEGNVTINAGTITSVNAKAGTIVIAGGTISKVADNGGNITISGGTITNFTGISGSGSITLSANMTGTYNVLNGADLKLNLAEHTMTGLNVNEGATLGINGTGTITTLTNAGTTNLTTGNITTVSSNTGTLNVAGGTVGTATSTGSVNVTAGTVTTLNANAGSTTVSGGSVTTLNAGDGTNVSTVKVSEEDETHGTVGTLNAKNHSNVTLASGSIVTTLNQEDGANVSIKNGAQIGEETIDSDIDFSNIKTTAELKAAVTIAKSGALTLGADVALLETLSIPASSTLTINTNGKTLSNNLITITADGQLTLKGTGSVSTPITNNGILNVNGATISGAVTNDATMNVSNGTVSGAITSSSVLTISGGNVTNATASAGTLNVTGGIAGTLNVNGGTVTVSGGDITTMNLTGGETTVSGGTITNLNSNDVATATLSAGSHVASFTINGGTVTVEADGIVTTYAGAGGANVTLPSYTITDDNAGSYPTQFKTASAKYTRQNVTAWGTICLPFSLTKSPNTTITLYTIDNITDNTLNLTEVTATPIAAGTPLIFGCSTPGTIEFASGDNTTKADVNKGLTGTSLESISIHNIKLKGCLTEETLTASSTPKVTDCYYINGDKFHQAAVSLKVPAYRAIIVDTTPASANVRPKELTISTDDSETTAIESLLNGQSDIIGYYDMNGNLRSTATKGVNIVKMANGKTVKLIIK